MYQNYPQGIRLRRLKNNTYDGASGREYAELAINAQPLEPLADNATMAGGDRSPCSALLDQKRVIQVMGDPHSTYFR